MPGVLCVFSIYKRWVDKNPAPAPPDIVMKTDMLAGDSSGAVPMAIASLNNCVPSIDGQAAES